MKNNSAFEKYLRQVSHRLNLPREVKERVMSDLETTIEARMEQGETAEEIMTSMGTPAAAAKELNEQMKEYAFQKSKWRFVFLALAILAVIWLIGWTILPAVFLAGMSEAASVGIIGGADGPTSIIVATSGSDAWKETAVTLLVLAVGVIGYIRLCRCKK